ncbi:hypothetical protein SAMN05428969_1363 [Devosia sp. YR412]|uniref:hypothetical protein n=1 Tax=Devosia sp. YR412 TaxID=1881030 RepID=UPI0008BF959F|nr:hypothetical protein [Devosia sp. YR412]SEP97491.1 hypothetical protein SAMN05428969_1363 [Devosia sp. YR412]
MKFAPAFGGLLALAISIAPVAAFAQEVGISGSPLPDQPYTLIYPQVMVSGGGEVGGPLTINHPTMPLQCVLAVIPVEDTSWTAEGALASLDATAVAEGWNDTLPGFTLGASVVTSYQSNPALQYEGASAGTGEAGPVTLVHTETVDAGNGYTLDCFFPTEVAADARPIVDAIIANFSTQQDAQPVAAMP